jgi:N-acetylmuramoyl-L-alanine amidase
MMSLIRRSPYLAFLFISFCWLLFSTPRSAMAVLESLQEADACRDGLKEKPEQKKTLSHWEACIERYKSFSSLPKDKSRAPYEIGRLYQERYFYSNDSEDLEEAAVYYARYLQTSSEEPPAADAKRQLDKLRRVLGPSVEETIKKETALPVDLETNEELTSEVGPVIPQGVAQGPAVVANIRNRTYPDYTRVVIDLNRPVLYKTRSVSSQTLSIILSQATLGELFKRTRTFLVDKGILKKIELKPREQGEIEVLLTFSKLGRHKIIPLTDPDRLVIDLFPTEQESPPKKGTEVEGRVDPPRKKNVIPPPSLQIQTIVIDPGHGGKDPGAIGSHGLTEKEVVLDVSHRLRLLIQKQLKKEVIMTRNDDTFIPLDERTLLANTKKADLFVSVHANSSPKRNTQGIEVYLLGRATDENAIATAARENATSHKAALDFQEVILNDLEREFTLNESLEFAHLTQNAFIETLIPKYPTETLGVKRAPFFVLAHTNMPAILAEISFISNPLEEKRLKNPLYRQKVAEALFIGIKQYIRALEAKS